MESSGDDRSSADLPHTVRKARRKCGRVAPKFERIKNSVAGGRFQNSASGCGVDMGRLGAEAKSAPLPSWPCKTSNQRMEA